MTDDLDLIEAAQEHNRLFPGHYGEKPKKVKAKVKQIETLNIPSPTLTMRVKVGPVWPMTLRLRILVFMARLCGVPVEFRIALNGEDIACGNTFEAFGRDPRA